MPYFTTDAELDISVDDFLYECDSDDIKELIDALIEDGYLTPKQIFSASSTNISPSEQEYVHMCETLSQNFYQMSNEEVEIIETLYKKYN